uniref:Aminoacyl-tRNA synthetase class II (D/K/N) domain-containing protein n=1 Tax=Gouania willdenowi TaxID=441366 RepID=A0A8C5GQB3_GOUWI
SHTNQIAFCNLDQLIFLIEAFFKFILRNVVKKCVEELDFFEKIKNKRLIEMGKSPIDLKANLEKIVDSDFVVIEYAEVIKTLITHQKENKAHFDDKNIFYGMDLKTEHERYICEVVYNCPTIIKNYPKDLKAFYMKVNDDGETVAALDLLVPGIGELIGGRFERLIMFIADLDNIKDTIPFPRAHLHN